jgi:FAD/FMN-containing dehydrogenase
MKLDFDRLKQSVRGDVVLPGDEAYAALSNTLMAQGAPAVIVKPANDDDVVAAIAFARENSLVLSVRSGGHSGLGASTNKGGMVIDLGLLNAVEVIDKEKDLVRIGAGATWGKVAEELEAHDLAISSGDTASVGVGGIALGGGIGWMVREFGLAIDNMVSADIVTADGELLHTNKKDHPDLFWALRGAGANFGVATSFVFKAHPCKGIVGGMISYDLKDFKQVLGGWVAAMRAAPRHLNSMLIVFPAFDPASKPQIVNLLCYNGSDKEAADIAIAPFLKIGTVVANDVKAKPYRDMLEEAHEMGPIKVRVRNGFIPQLTDEVIDTIAEHYGDGKTVLQLRFLGGQLDETPTDAMAFPHRNNEGFLIIPSFGSPDTPDDEADKAADAAWAPMRKYVRGAYANFFTDTHEATIALAYPGETLSKLRKLKAVYDPEDVFNQNVNIRPSK